MSELILENDTVKLSLLSNVNYTHLHAVAFQKDLIAYSPSDISTPALLSDYVTSALRAHSENTAIPFIIYDKRSSLYAGSTRFGRIDHKNKTLEIGWTWIGREFQGTGLNKQVKFLMLHYAFERMRFMKVEFRIDERNTRSRKAVEKIGGKLEGILRNNVIMIDGFRRNTCCYGILYKEWEGLKTSVFKGYRYWES